MAEIKWHRPLLPFEEVLYSSSSGHGFLQLTPWVDIVSPEPLKEELIKSAFQYLWRKCENLRACIRERDGQLWFAEMEDENIDFEVVKNKTVTEVWTEIQKTRFNHNTGPNWKAAVLQHGTSDNKYSIFFHFNHAILDGLTSVKICKKIVNYFDACICGEEPDNTQLGKLSYSNDLFDVINKEKVEILANLELKEKLAKEFKDTQTVDPLMEKFFKTPVDIESRKHLYESLGEFDTNLLIKKCKTNGVTVHSALTAALNCAFMVVQQNMGIVQDSYRITGCHWVSFRRHLQNKDALGFIVGEYIHTDRLSPNVMNSFWDYVKSLNSELHFEATGRKMIQQVAYQDIVEVSFDFTSTKTPFYSYHMTNYCDLGFEEEKKVKSILFSRHLNVGRTPLCIMVAFYTFKGKLQTFIDYMPGYVDDNTAKSIHSTLLSILLESI